MAAKVLSGAGANVVISAGGADALDKVAQECAKLGGKVETVPVRPSSEANCDRIVDAAVKAFGRVDILVVASGINKVSKIVDQKAEDFLAVMDVNVTQSWLMARAAGRQMLKQGQGGKVVLMSSARGLLGHPAGYAAYCASKSAVDGITKALGCEWGAYRHHGERARADRLPLAARPNGCSPMTSAARPCAPAFSRACRRAGWASRPISRGRCCSWRRRRRTSTPATSSTPTAATRRADYEYVAILRVPDQRRTVPLRYTLHRVRDTRVGAMSKARIAVIGAGLMGHGIAQVFAVAGHDVTITDSVAASVDCAKARIAAGLKDLGDDRARPNASRRITNWRRRCAMPTTSSRQCRRTCRSSRSCSPRSRRTSARIRSSPATRRSSRSPTSWAGSKHRERALGTHWWNPPTLVPLVEVIGTQWTSPQAIDFTMKLHADAGKKPAHVKKDVPGFIGNRLQHALWREAVSLVERGICDAETVDTVIKAAFGRRLAVLGPLENADLVGTDLTLAIHQTVLPDIEHRPGPSPYLEQLVTDGKLGFKSGEGFRTWSEEEKIALRAAWCASEEGARGRRRDEPE